MTESNKAIRLQDDVMEESESSVDDMIFEGDVSLASRVGAGTYFCPSIFELGNDRLIASGDRVIKQVNEDPMAGDQGSTGQLNRVAKRGLMRRNAEEDAERWRMFSFRAVRHE